MASKPNIVDIYRQSDKDKEHVEYLRKLVLLKEQNSIVARLMGDSTDIDKIPKHLHENFRNLLNKIE